MALQAAFYKGTRPGLAGVYNRAVRAWEHGKYSHVEIVFSDGVAASSSFEDGGVRFKHIEFNPANWDLIKLDPLWESYARKWFLDNEGRKYDIMGNLHHIIGFLPHDKEKMFCSEAIAAALGYHEPWRYMPNALYASLITIYPQG